MIVYNTDLKSKFTNNVTEKHIILRYQPSIYNKPIISNPAPTALKPLS